MSETLPAFQWPSTSEHKISESQPRWKYVLIRRDSAEGVTKGGIVIPDNAKEDRRPFRGTVLAAGPGWTDKNGTFHALTITPGTQVIYQRYRGIEFEEDGEHYVFLMDDEIVGEFPMRRQ